MLENDIETSLSQIQTFQLVTKSSFVIDKTIADTASKTINVIKFRKFGVIRLRQ